MKVTIKIKRNKMIISRGCYVNEDDSDVVYTDPETKIAHSIQMDTPCDRSDLAGLNDEHERRKLRFLHPSADLFPFTHLVKDSTGDIFAVELVKE